VLPAHITPVFPFADDALGPHLSSHIAQSIAGIAPFDIELTGPTVADSEYLFLNVATGVEALALIHDRLYSGLLGSHLSATHRYVPHVTVGHFASADQLADAAREAQIALPEPLVGRVTELAVFRLDQPTHGAVQFTVPLSS
jgi:2'-5' RNA ligase